MLRISSIPAREVAGQEGPAMPAHGRTRHTPAKSKNPGAPPLATRTAPRYILNLGILKPVKLAH
eukprot:9466868-Pyramimonas_sp.AAC.1